VQIVQNSESFSCSFAGAALGDNPARARPVIVAGISMEKSGTTDALVNLGTQVERIQTPAAVPATVPVVKKNRKQSSER
jgi:hypothetical protein